MSTVPSLATLDPSLRRASVCHDQCLFASWALRTSCKQTMAPSRRAWLASLVNKGTLSWDDSGMIESFYYGDTTSFQREHCPCDLDEAEMLWAARADIVSAGKEPDAVTELKNLLTETGTPFTEPVQETTDTYALTTFFVDAPTRSLNPGWTDHLREVINQFEPSAGVVVSGSSGFEAFDVGLADLAVSTITELVDRLVANGVHRVVVEAPGALFMFRRFGPKSLEVLHTSEWLEQTISPASDSVRDPEVVTVQDSALLARFCDVTNSPRLVLEALSGVTIAEMPTSSTLANPTGGRLWPPDQSDLVVMAESRVAEARTTEAKTIITLGPYSRRNLSQVAKSEGIRVLDLVEFISERTKK